MIKSLFLLGVRNLFKKDRLFTIVNITGLAVGLATILLVALFIYDEYNFDQHHEKGTRIYRVVLDFKEVQRMKFLNSSDFMTRYQTVI